MDGDFALVDVIDRDDLRMRCRFLDSLMACSVKVTDELAERLADDAEAGYSPRQVQVRPTGRGRPRLATGEGPSPTVNARLDDLAELLSSVPITTVSTSPTSSAGRCTAGMTAVVIFVLAPRLAASARDALAGQDFASTDFLPLAVAPAVALALVLVNVPSASALEVEVRDRVGRPHLHA